MGRKQFIDVLSNKTGLDIDKCNKINDILESTFIVGKKNKDKILDKIMSELNINNEEANKIYNSAMEILVGEIGNKIKNPFKSLD